MEACRGQSWNLYVNFPPSVSFSIEFVELRATWMMKEILKINQCIFKALCACRLSCFNQVWLFVIPWTIAHQAPLSMRFFHQEYWSELPCPPPGDPPNPEIKPVSPAQQVDSLPLSHRGSPFKSIIFLRLKETNFIFVETWERHI